MSEFEKYLANRLEDSEVRAGYEAKSREYAADDDLRAKLEEALDGMILPATGGIVILGSDHTPTNKGIDALMPVVREALAAAWDDGFDVGYADRANRDTTVPMPSNPWREDQP